MLAMIWFCQKPCQNLTLSSKRYDVTRKKSANVPRASNVPVMAFDNFAFKDSHASTGTAKVKNGLVKNDDLLMKSPLLRIDGAGEVSLPKETIDYTLTTKFVGSLEGQGGKERDKLKGVSIPVHVAGTFSKPTYTPDLAVVVTEAAKAEVDKRVKKELQKKLGDGLSDTLKGLLH